MANHLGQNPSFDRPLADPVWMDELHTGLARRSHFVISGNVRDIYPYRQSDEDVRFLTLQEVLWQIASEKGFSALLTYSPNAGLELHPECDESVIGPISEAGIVLGQPLKSGLELAEMHRKLTTLVDCSAAVVFDYAAHLFEDQDRDLTAVLIESDQAVRRALAPAGEQRPSSATLWIVDRPGDLPEWFTKGNDNLREIVVELPNLEDRYAFAETLISYFGDGEDLDEEGRADFLEQFSLRADGMTLVGMRNVALLSSDESLTCSQIDEAIRIDRLGTRRNPWKSPVMRVRMMRAEEIITRRIKGQKHAIEKSLDILTRSIAGLSGAQASSRLSRPRGVMFLVGPTGTGKTELAKAITELLFGDDTACHRFDMSEFMEENSIGRLIGAPPGHPGHERGGELVNAMHKRPFSVVLFDEVEKAHPRILDMFLQILDEGRLTDSRGSTGYFSEALIIFTSNIGMISSDHTQNAGMNILPSDDYQELDRKLIQAVRDHFRLELNRPELFNRLGQNIISFEFIDGIVGSEIFSAILQRVVAAVKAEHGIEVEIEQDAFEELRSICMADWFEGGRGIANRIETHVINPLAREIFAHQPKEKLRINAVQRIGDRAVIKFS